MQYVTLEWVEWFKNRQLLELDGNIPPSEAEVSFYAALERTDIALQLKQKGLRQTWSGSCSMAVSDHIFIQGVYP